jgi:hypothetical protein
LLSRNTDSGVLYRHKDPGIIRRVNIPY